MIQNSRGINYLPSHVPTRFKVHSAKEGRGSMKERGKVTQRILVISVTNVEGLSGESVWLYINIGTCDLVHETRFAHVGVPTDDDGASGGIDARKACQMLADLLQVCQTGCQLSDNCAHTKNCINSTLATPKPLWCCGMCVRGCVCMRCVARCSF